LGNAGAGGTGNSAAACRSQRAAETGSQPKHGRTSGNDKRLLEAREVHRVDVVFTIESSVEMFDVLLAAQEKSALASAPGVEGLRGRQSDMFADESVLFSQGREAQGPFSMGAN
jgi:hypothetical protein